jgi:hypothetical protein
MGEYKAVKVGYSWPGFFFGALWALFAKLWKVAGIIIIGSFVLGMVLSGLPVETLDVVSNLLGLGISILVGFMGNSWIDGDLTSRGFELRDNVMAPNKDAAIALYLKSNK